MFDLASYLPYLINRAGARLAEAFGAELASRGLTVPMWRAMAALHRKGDQKVGRLAEMALIEVSTLSRLLGSMEEKGLVLRQRSDADARTVCVRLTESGARLIKETIPRAIRFEKRALADLTPAEAKALKAMLARVIRNVDALDEELSARGRHLVQAGPNPTGKRS